MCDRYEAEDSAEAPPVNKAALFFCADLRCAAVQRLVKEWAALYRQELLDMWNRQEFRQLPGLE
ncbi:MAG: hypothetical protein ABR915_23430 [Thermoguttaceae bacterium]|jgi:hypothetical protein